MDVTTPPGSAAANTDPHPQGAPAPSRLRSFWRVVRVAVLLLPIALFFIPLPHEDRGPAAVQKLGAAMAEQIDVAAVRVEEGRGDDVIDLDILDLERATYARGLRESLDRRTGRLRGQFVAGRDGRTLVVFRMRMVCCPSDAIPITVLVVSEDGLPDVAAMQWVEVRGQVQFPRRRDGGTMPILVVASRDQVVRVPPEANLYLR